MAAPVCLREKVRNGIISTERGVDAMKKIVAMVLIFLVLLHLGGCSRVMLGSVSSGTVVYDYDGISFEEKLTEEEVVAVKKVLNGKAIDPSFLSTPACGFNYDIAIIIDGRRFALACDDCGTVQDYGSLGYIHISDAERDVLEEIFTSRGGEFPCI